MRINDLFFGCVFAALGAGTVIVSRTFPPSPGQPFGAAVFPSLVGVVMVVCGLRLCVSGMRHRPEFLFIAPPWARTRQETAAVLWTLAGLLFCALFVRSLGFAVCLAVLMLPLMAILGKYKKALVVWAATAALIEILFVWLLRAPLPRGVIESIFR